VSAGKCPLQSNSNSFPHLSALGRKVPEGDSRISLKLPLHSATADIRQFYGTRSTKKRSSVSDVTLNP
jgi:hypothetical protein